MNNNKDFWQKLVLISFLVLLTVIFGSLYLNEVKKNNKINAEIRADEDKKIKDLIISFQLNLVNAQANHSQSLAATYVLLKTIQEMNQEDIVTRRALKMTDLSESINPAKKAVESMELAFGGFEIIYSLTNNIKITREFKESLIEFDEVVRNNLYFALALQEGRFDSASLKDWINDVSKYKSLLNRLDLECKKLNNERK